MSFSWYIVDGGPLDGAMLPVPDEFLNLPEIQERKEVVIPFAEGVVPSEDGKGGRRVLSAHLYKIREGKLVWDGPESIEPNDGDRLARMLTIVNGYRKEDP